MEAELQVKLEAAAEAWAALPESERDWKSLVDEYIGWAPEAWPICHGSGNGWDFCDFCRYQSSC